MKNKDRPSNPDEPYGASGKTLNERRAASAEALKRQRAHEEAEYYRQRELPTLEDKVNALHTAVIAVLGMVQPTHLAAKLIVELNEVMEKETRGN